MQAEQLFHRIRYLGSAVFGHEPGDALRQVVFLQDLVHQVAVKDRPRAGVFRGTRLQEGRQFVGHGMRARAGLARDRHRASRHAIFGRNLPLPGRLHLATDESQGSVQTRLCLHNTTRFQQFTSIPTVTALRSFNYNLPQFARSAKGILSSPAGFPPAGCVLLSETRCLECFPPMDGNGRPGRRLSSHPRLSVKRPVRVIKADKIRD